MVTGKRYLSFLEDICTALIDINNISVKAMLVGEDYLVSYVNHTTLADITDEITSDNYTAGGSPVTSTLTKDTNNDKIIIELGEIIFPNLTANINGVVYYVNNGETLENNNLIAFIDGINVTLNGIGLKIPVQTIEIT